MYSRRCIYIYRCYIDTVLCIYLFKTDTRNGSKTRCVYGNTYFGDKNHLVWFNSSYGYAETRGVETIREEKTHELYADEKKEINKQTNKRV